MSDEPKQWGVVINETGLNSCSSEAANYWHTRRQQFEASGTLTVLDAGPMGDVVRIGPYTRDDAQFMHDHLVEHGAAKAHLKVRRIPS